LGDDDEGTPMSRVVLVTGAAGFIGSAVVRSLSESGDRVIAVDALLDGLYPAKEKIARFEAISTLPGVEVHTMDLRSADLSVLPADIGYVINEAAMPGLGLSWSDFELYSSCNLSSIARLMQQSQHWHLRKFVQISTSSVYGKNAVGDETLPTLPVSPYGVTKLAAENLAFAYQRDSRIPVTILRYFSVYGPGQRPDMAYRKFIARALAGDPIEIYGTGKQSRSNTFIDDCVAGTISALDNARVGEVYNIAGSSERSLNEALAIIEANVDQALDIRHLEAARGDQDRTFGETTKASKELGFVNSTSLEDGLQAQIMWQRENAF
jgi:nucleoside-diphosphate-sugar epimerase